MEGLPDDELVKRAKNGDRDAFAELVGRCQEKIYQTIFRLTWNHLDTDDLVQETFMHAFRSIKSFKQKASFSTWVYRIAVNLTLNHFKKIKRDREEKHISYENCISEGNSAGSISSPEKNSLKKELRKKLDEAINSLPLPYRSSFVLVEIQGMSHGQAAYVLQCSENTVSWRMHQARKLLQGRLRPYLERGMS